MTLNVEPYTLRAPLTSSVGNAGTISIHHFAEPNPRRTTFCQLSEEGSIYSVTSKLANSDERFDITLESSIPEWPESLHDVIRAQSHDVIPSGQFTSRDYMEVKFESVLQGMAICLDSLFSY
jgi:hypothetical protein